MKSPAHHDHHIFQWRCHMVQTLANSRDLTQPGSDPQANCWPGRLPLRTHHSCAARCLCTKVNHLAGLLHLNPRGHNCPRMAPSRPSVSLSTLITSLISPGPASKSSTSKMDAIPPSTTKTRTTFSPAGQENLHMN